MLKRIVQNYEDYRISVEPDEYLDEIRERNRRWQSRSRSFVAILLATSALIALWVML